MHWREVQKRRGALRESGCTYFFFEVADEAKNTPRDETLVPGGERLGLRQGNDAR
jgi:hypothetical protein